MTELPVTITSKSKLVQDSDRIPATIHLDLDGGLHIFRVHGWPHDAQDDPLFATGLRRALDFFDRAKVRATLFVIAEDLDDPRKRELLQEAVHQGHEIASHSLTHRKLTTLNRDDKRREIFESRERLAQELSVEVRGFRAPGFALDGESLELIDAAGYSYDSSLFPSQSFARRIGLANLGKSPHHPLEDRQLIELPLPAHSPLPLPFHPCYSLVLGTWYFRAGLARFRRMGAPLILLFHLTDFADPLPENLLPNRRASLYTLSHINGERKRQRCEQMLELVNLEYQLVETRRLLTMQSTLGADSLEMVTQL